MRNYLIRHFPIDINTMPNTERLNADNLKIGENIRAAIHRANPKSHRAGVTLVKIAKAIPMSYTGLKRAVAGNAGLAEEKIVKIANVIGSMSGHALHPGHLIEGITARAREDRFPHIPSPNNRNKRDTARKGMAVASVEALVKNPAILSSFFGGVDKEHIEPLQSALLTLRDQAISWRKGRVAVGRSTFVSPATPLSFDQPSNPIARPTDDPFLQQEEPNSHSRKLTIP
jgi:hypothetical protein